jgi:hypothetical protein
LATKPPTFEELPLTPEMTASIRRAGGWEAPAAVAGAVLLAAAAWSALVGPGPGLGVFLGGLGLLALLAAGVSRRGRLRAVREGRFTRARGRLEVRNVNHAEGGSWEFVAGPRSLDLDERDYRALAPLMARAAEADFSEAAEILFEVRDATGQVLWRRGG